MKKISDISVRQTMLPRPSNSHKGDFGRVLLIGGNEQMGGAIILAASAAVNSGAGLVITATHSSNKTALLSRLPESMFLSFEDSQALSDQINKADVILIGPGLGRNAFAKELLETSIAAVHEDQLLILDGDALTLLAEHKWSLKEKTVLLTPHIGEWLRFDASYEESDSPETTQSAIKQLGVEVVLKKHRTQIYWKEHIWENPIGNPGMATGGMGDTLAGMIAGFTAQFKHREPAVIAAVYLHSKIGDYLYQSQHVTLPTAVIEHIPFIMKRYEFKQISTL